MRSQFKPGLLYQYGFEEYYRSAGRRPHPEASRKQALQNARDRSRQGHRPMLVRNGAIILEILQMSGCSTGRLFIQGVPECPRIHRRCAWNSGLAGIGREFPLDTGRSLSVQSLPVLYSTVIPLIHPPHFSKFALGLQNRNARTPDMLAVVTIDAAFHGYNRPTYQHNLYAYLFDIVLFP